MIFEYGLIFILSLDNGRLLVVLELKKKISMLDPGLNVDLQLKMQAPQHIPVPNRSFPRSVIW